MSNNDEDRLSKADCYNAAVQFRNEEFRTLGQRVNAFLITQSILVAAFVYMVTSQNLVAPEFIAWGIILAGIWLCFFYCQAGRSGSQAAFKWREYMRHIENKESLTPWNWLYDHYKHKHGQDTRKNLVVRLICQKCWLERSPLPIAWLISPAIFWAVWAGATYYIHAIEGLSLSWYHTASIRISLAAVASYIIYTGVVWWLRRG